MYVRSQCTSQKIIFPPYFIACHGYALKVWALEEFYSSVLHLAAHISSFSTPALIYIRSN